MSSKRLTLLAAALTLAGLAFAGCGGSSSSGSKPSAGAPGALSADAKSAATGDIPDTQNFLTFRGAGVSMRYPEGWAQKAAAGGGVTFQDKNNLVRIAIAKGATPTVAGVSSAVKQLQSAQHSLKVTKAAAQVTIKGKPAVKVTYTTQSAPNPVTGKRVTLMVDRYALDRAGKVAVVDLGTPVGVDNVDAYRMMIASFQWR